MKRVPPVPLPYDIRQKRIRFHWQKCDECGMEFKGEEMWEFRLPAPSYWDNAVTREPRVYHFCKECFPTVEDLAPCLNRRTTLHFRTDEHTGMPIF